MTQAANTPALHGDDSFQGIDHGRRVLAAGMMVATLANMCIGIAPISMGAMVQAGHLTMAAIGRVSTVEVLLLVLGSLIGPAFLKAGGFRRKVRLTAIALVLANIATYFAGLPFSIYGVRAVAGLLEGVLLSAMMILVVTSREPERVESFYLAFSTIPQIVAIYVLSAWLLPVAGPASGFGVLGALAILGAVVSGALPDHAPVRLEPRRKSVRHGRISAAALSILLVVVLHNAAIGCAWYYLERLSVLAGASAKEAGLLTIVFLVFQFLAASGVCFRRAGRPRRYALLELSLLLAALTAAMPFFAQFWSLLVIVAIYGFFQIILSPISLRLLIAFDASGRAGEQLMTMSFLGLSLGSFVASFVVGPAHVAGAYYVGATLMVVAGAIAALSIFVRRNGLETSSQTI